CDLGIVAFSTPDIAPPKVTIKGTVKSAAIPGTLVRNLVKVESQPADADLSNNEASNAYLIPGLSDGPTSRSTGAASSDGSTRTPGYLAPVAAGVLVFGGLASVILLRRRRR